MEPACLTQVGQTCPAGVQSIVVGARKLGCYPVKRCLESYVMT